MYFHSDYRVKATVTSNYLFIYNAASAQKAAKGETVTVV